MNVNDIKNRLINDSVGKRVQPTDPSSGGTGVVISLPGTERVTLNLKDIQLMECAANVKGRDKIRYLLVEKETYAMRESSFVTSRGWRVHILTKRIYEILFVTLGNADRMVKEMSSDLRAVTDQRDAYKTVIDSLRSNGIID